MESKQKFNVFCPSIEKSVDSTSEDLILEGVATTTGMDLEGDYMTRDCIKSLKEQILPLNIHMSHKKETKDVVGSVLDVIKTDDDTLKIKFIVLPSYRDFIKELLDYGVNLGLSIRGKALDYVKTDTGLKVNQVKLLEVSLTPLPANWETFGTVKQAEKSTITSQCFNGACMQLVKDMSTEQESKEETFDESEDVSLGEQKVIDLINEAFSNFEDRIIKYLESEYRIGDIKQFLQNASTTESNEPSDDESKEDGKILSDESVDEETEKNDENAEKDEKKKVEKSFEVESSDETELVEDELEKSLKVETTETKEKVEMTEEIEKTENIELTEQVDEVVEEPIEKEISFDVEEITKSIEDKIVENEELIKSIEEKVIEKITSQLSESLTKDVTDNILKDLSENREPVNVEIPKIDIEKEEEITNQPMNRFDIAKSLARKE